MQIHLRRPHPVQLLLVGLDRTSLLPCRQSRFQLRCFARQLFAAVDLGLVGYFRAKVRSLLGEDGDFRSELRAGTTEALKETLAAILQEVAVKLAISLALKIISLLNPAGALFQLLRTAYDAVMFFVKNMGEILKLFDTARQAFMTAVQGGGVGAIAGKVESLLAGAVVPALDAIARLIGIASLPDGIKKVLMTLKRLAQKPAKAFLSAIGRPLSRLFDKALAFFGLTGIKPKPLIEPSACSSKPNQSPKQQTRVWVQPDGQVMVQDQMQQRRKLEEFLHTLPAADVAPARSGQPGEAWPPSAWHPGDRRDGRSDRGAG